MSCSHAFACAVALLAFVVAPARPSEAQAVSQRALSIEDYYRLKTVGAPEVSPDGRWVAFTIATRIEATNGQQSEVWLVPSDASSPARRVSTEGANAVAPSWTDDARLRFTSASRPVVVDPASPERVDTSVSPGATGGRGGGAGAVMSQTSPDGGWIASVRNTPLPSRAQTFASEFEKRANERFKGVQFDWMEFHRDGGPFPTPNAKDPSVSPPQEIFIAPAGDAGNAKPLTSLGLRPAGLQWNRDGNALLFTADSAYRNVRVYGRNDIWTVGVDGRLRKLTSNTEYGYNGARYSPDGQWILASRQMSTDAIIAKKLSQGAAVELVVIPANGGAERVLTADWDYIPADVQWSPDGSHVYFTGGVGGTDHLFRVSPAGGAVEQVTTGQRRLSGFSFDRAFKRIAYQTGVFEAPSELWSANIDGSNERQLTRVHEPFTREIALSRAERLQFKSADGTPIEGWLTFPHGYRADGGPYPLVVSSHGGPHSATEYGFNFKNQYFAASGYFVLETNFRSSTNYGEKFLWATWGAWGTKDGQDVMAGIDHVLARYPIDRKQVATIGHSYGGFMTNWLITQYPDRFAAAIPGAGIVNWMSDYGNADIPRTKETEFYGSPWEERARAIMIKQSPLTYASRAKAPTLFINGEVDQRVPVSEAQQMFVALQKNGVPSKMIVYADMPHGISGSWNNVHRMLSEREWLDRWVKKTVP